MPFDSFLLLTWDIIRRVHTTTRTLQEFVPSRVTKQARTPPVDDPDTFQQDDAEQPLLNNDLQGDDDDQDCNNSKVNSLTFNTRGAGRQADVCAEIYLMQTGVVPLWSTSCSSARVKINKRGFC